MYRKLLASVIATLLVSSFTPISASAAKVGASCSKLGQVQNSGSKKLTCVKKGSKNVWVEAKVAAYKPKGWNLSHCDIEPGLKGFAQSFQVFMRSQSRCVGPMRVPESKMPTAKPVSKIDPVTSLADVGLCKARQSSNTRAWKGFPGPGMEQDFMLNRHPSPNTVIQVIPIFSSDAPKTNKTPYQDYKFYFDFVKQYFAQINDGPGKIDLRVPDEYIEFKEKIEPYAVHHGNDGPVNQKFFQDVINTVDSQFDFSKVNYTLVVVPAGTPSGVISQQGVGRVLTNEGPIYNISTAQPATVTAANNTTDISLASPSMWIHEFYHPGINLGDNYGAKSNNYDANRGMGDWGLMSQNNGDLLAWQKWFLGFLQDSQVRCVAGGAAPTQHWLAPSSIKTPFSKLVVIPLSQSKVIVVESIRAVGLSYKYSKVRSGALVYTVDASDTSHNFGYLVMYPDNRRPSFSNLRMEDASLKLGESLTLEGLKITNVEWGDFGDVIRVEPAK
jgi:M6 family metalloprotease-like protein